MPSATRRWIGADAVLYVEATDADLPANGLTFSWRCAEGASIGARRARSSDADEAQGPGDYTFNVKVCDGAASELCDEGRSPSR